MESQSSQLALQQPDSTAPTRILFDGRKLGDGGIGVYIDNTVRGLLSSGSVDVTVIASREQAKGVSWCSEVSWHYDSSKQYSVSEYFLLPRRINFELYDIYHSPHFTLPFGIPIPTVVTIHDLIHIEYPEAFYYPVVAKLLISSAVARASRVVAVSEDTRRAIVRLTDADPHKVIHIPNAVPPFLQTDEAMVGQRARSGVVSRLGGEERYFLTVVSNCKPHKGILDLFQAWHEFVIRFQASQERSSCPLLLVVGYGAKAIQSDRKLSELADKLGTIRVIGAVDTEILRHLYKHAEALVVPSLAEGFCLPALEAQSVGTRVICRPVPALQELITESDVVAADRSVTALADALLASAVSPKPIKTVIEAHLERFSLWNTTDKLRTLYSSLVSGRDELYQQRRA